MRIIQSGIFFAASIIFTLITLAFPSLSSAYEFTGFMAIDSRIFLHTPQFKPQKSNNAPSLVLEPEAYYVSDDEHHTITFRPFMRYDANDHKRSHVDIRQLDWLYAHNSWEIRAGISKVFWGVIESNHLVDIINQTDAVEDIDGEDKLGQPMLQAALIKEWGTLRLFYLPYFRERTFAGQNGRLRASTPVATDRSIVNNWHHDIALRYTHTLGDWDLGIAHFSGMGREPGFTQSGTELIPTYATIDQTSLDLQLTTESWLWKLEALTRAGHGDRFAAFSGGFEYSFYGVFDSAVDIGLLLEYHRDDRDSNAPSTFLNDDLFFGTRIALNDTQDTEFLGGVMVDRHSNARFYSAEASRRLGNRWKLELDARFFGHFSSSFPESSLGHDDHIQLRLARYF